MKRILLINPRYEMETLRVVDEERLDVKTDCMPLGLATVAALTPSGYQVAIWDEFIKGPIEKSGVDFKGNYDLVGLTSTRIMFLRTKGIGAFFREQGIPTVIGGPGVSATPDRFRGFFDVLFIGESELTWPQFLKEWETGSYRAEYRQIEKPDIAASPMPRWELIAEDMSKYGMGMVQTTRGCPYDCEYCDVVYLYGRRQRHKPIERVIEEVKVLQRYGVSTIFFADDNFVGNHTYAKEVLTALIPVNNSFPKPIKFATQASIDTSRDEELLELLADANFWEICVGIESPNKEALKEMGKFNNLKGDLLQEIHKIMSYGVPVRGAFIGGFDSDDVDCFELQHEFVQKAFLPIVSVHMLNAPMGTRLWRRFREEGRVIDIMKVSDRLTQRIISNTVPKHISRVQLMQAFRDVYLKIFSWESFKERLCGFVSIVKRPPAVPQAPVAIDELMNLGSSLHLDPVASKAIKEIFSYTEQQAPFMLARVKDLIIQFIRFSKSALDLIPKLDQQIQLESSGAIKFELDSRPVTVPKEFIEPFHTVFPDIYTRAYLNMTDKNKVPQALVEVFVEFLVKEEGFSTLEAHHVPLLHEIVDRTCARLNGQKFEEFTPVETAAAPVPDAKRLRLHDDILKSVEQELLKLVQSQEA